MSFVRLALALVMAIPCLAQATKPAAIGVLSADEMQRLMPPAVFFQGQTAATQVRNSFGVRFSDGGLTLAGLVDTGGYSTSIRERYQFYLLADTSVEVDGKKLTPGSYGCGFVQDGVFLVMDLGGHDLFRGKVTHDTELTRPRPLQIVAGKAAGEFRLYLGRDYVTLRQAH